MEEKDELKEAKEPNSLHPRNEENPVKHLNRSDWALPRNLENKKDFDREWKTGDILFQNRRNKIVWIQHRESKQSLVMKVYKTYGNDKLLLKRFREFVFVTNTKLMEYAHFYYDGVNKEVFILMPFYGETLKKRIAKNGGFEDEQKVKVMAAELLDKIWIIHNAGYVHCDLKPSNIILKEESDSLKLIDFELIHKQNAKSKYVGTMGWSAPEIDPDDDKNRYKSSSDLFSFGLVILYLLSGQQPFEISKGQRRLFAEDMRAEHPEITDKEIKRKMHAIWHKEIILKSERMIQNYLVKLYYKDQISLNLFHLLLHGLLVYDPKKRWKCKQIYHSKWFQDIRP